MSKSQKLAELEDNLSRVARLSDDPEVLERLRAEIEEIKRKQESERLEIVSFGTISSGKSSLMNALAGRDVFETDARGGTTVSRNEIPWPGNDKVTLVDTPGLGEIDGEMRASVAAEAARDADLILVVIDGPLRDTEFELLSRLGQMEKRILICLNKEDWYPADEEQELLGQVAEQVKDFVAAKDIVAVRSRPTQRLRKRIGSDGHEVEEWVDVDPNIEPLAQRMLAAIRRDGQDLLLANLLMQSRGLMDNARQSVQESIDRKAQQIVDKYMWASGGAAALTPLPFVDLAAGIGISSKMVFDLARVYRQDLDADVAMNLLGQQGKNLIAILGTNLITPAVASLMGSAMKTVPGIGTIAGGLLQGIVQALVTRWIGAIFIQYFKNEMQEPIGGMASLARREWERLTTANELRKLINTARQRLGSDQPVSEDDE